MSKKKSGDYEIGKGKPPKHSQFQSGQSGNPKGRPKGSKNVDQVLSKILNEKITITDAGKKMIVDKLEGALRVLFNKSFEGRPQSLKLLMDLFKEREGANAIGVSNEFSDDDHAALMEELSWLEEVREAHEAESSDGSE